MPIAGRAYVQTDGGEGVTVDVILRGGHPFLVPMWLDSPDGRETKPARIIPLDGLRHQDQPQFQPRWVVNDPIPKAVLEGRASSAEAMRFRVIEAPEIVLPGPRAIH